MSLITINDGEFPPNEENTIGILESCMHAFRDTIEHKELGAPCCRGFWEAQGVSASWEIFRLYTANALAGGEAVNKDFIDSKDLAQAAVHLEWILKSWRVVRPNHGCLSYLLPSLVLYWKDLLSEVGRVTGRNIDIHIFKECDKYSSHDVETLAPVSVVLVGDALAQYSYKINDESRDTSYSIAVGTLSNDTGWKHLDELLSQSSLQNPMSGWQSVCHTLQENATSVEGSTYKIGRASLPPRL